MSVELPPDDCGLSSADLFGVAVVPVPKPIEAPLRLPGDASLPDLTCARPWVFVFRG